MNELHPTKKVLILHMLVEGMGINAASRVSETNVGTILDLLYAAGINCDDFMDGEFRKLRPEHWQIDEMWTFCGKKDKHLTPEEKAEGILGSQYLFLAIAEKTKLVPTFLVGKRDEDSARAFMKNLASHFDLSSHIRHRLSTDGFLPYIAAVEAAFKSSVDYGQNVKNYNKKREEPFVTRTVIKGSFDEDQISTSLMERANMTMRTFMRRFVRRTLSFSKKLGNLRAAVGLQLAYYNYCWRHRSLKRRSPAMAAGLTDHCWTMRELLKRVGVLPSDEKPQLQI